MKNLFFSILAVALLSLSACSSDVEELRRTDEGLSRHIAVLHLDGSIQHFDAQTRGTTTDWEDGAKLYIQFQTDEGPINGSAVYNLSSNEWTMSFNGNIPQDKKNKCEVYYFENPVIAGVSSVILNAQSAVFADDQGTYLYEDDIVTVQTHLKAQTGRIRFRGEAGYQFSITGLKWHNLYNNGSNTFSLQTSSLTLTVGTDGYTPYVYASFADEDKRQLSVDSEDGKDTFIKYFASVVLAKGKSGYVYVPTIETPNGWQIDESDPLGLCPDRNHPHAIDLGLDVKFACCNVGASSPIECGDYFSWGETTPKETYEWTTYKWRESDKDDRRVRKYCTNSVSGNCDNKTTLEPWDDAAKANWEGTWRMPTIYEWENLVKGECKWAWRTINGMKGCRITATNGNSIFIPAAGRYYGSEKSAFGTGGEYWSSSLHLSKNANAHKLDVSVYGLGVTIDGGDASSRSAGFSVRPVTE